VIWLQLLYLIGAIALGLRKCGTSQKTECGVGFGFWLCTICCNSANLIPIWTENQTANLELLLILDLSRRHILVFHIHQINISDHHPAASVQDIVPESILKTENWLTRNCDLDNPNDSEHDWEADNESDMELDNGIEPPEIPKQKDDCTAHIVPGVILPTWRSMKITENVLVTDNGTETQSNQGYHKWLYRLWAYDFTRFCMLLDRECRL